MNRINLTLKMLVVACLLLSQSENVVAQCGCTFVISTSNTEPPFDGVARGVKPGDKICFANGTRYGLTFKNVHGAPGNPVIITNMCDGKVVLNCPINWGQCGETDHSDYFRFTGTGNPNEQYGIEIIGAQQGANFHNLSNHFEVDHVYVHDTGSSGMQGKTDPTCDPATWRGNFLLQGIQFHDNMTVNTGTEGYYVGNSHHDLGVTKTCNGVDTFINEHLVTDVQIYNNIVTNTGNEGIQCGATSNLVVHHNVLTNTGYINVDPAQSNGLQAGSGTQMIAYNNLIMHGGKGFGIDDTGGGGTYYNNIVMNALSGGIRLQDLNVDYAPVGYTIFNNTFINNKDIGVYMYSDNPQMSYYYNNIVIGQNQTGYTYVKYNCQSCSKWTEANNIRTQDITTLKFVNASTNDFHLLTGSPAIDGGKDVSSYGVNFDFDGKSRPKGTSFDVGALEFQPNGPHANAGADQTLALPTNSIILVGSGTSATGITGYQWTKKSGNAATLTNAATPSLTVSGLTAGIYVFELLVTDASGSDFDDVTVTVNASATNQNPVANAGPDKTITLPTNSVILPGQGTDADGTIASYAWSQQSGPAAATLVNAAAPTLTVNALVAGTYIFLLTVTDDKGAQNSDNVQVLVNPAATNNPPNVTVPASQTVYLPTNQITLTGSATDPDAGGSIASLVWTKRSGGAATLNGTTTNTLSVTGMVAGTYVFRLTASDDKAATAFAEVTVNVIAANQPPVANAGQDQSLTLPTNSTTITGTGTDADGTVNGYSWVKVSGPSATLVNANTATLSVANMVQGAYVFGLTVTDNQGATGYDEVVVAVSVAVAGPNELPLALAGGNVSISLPTNSVNLYGAGFDPDGTIVSYAWVKISGGAATLTNANKPTLTASGLTAGQYTFGLTVTDDKGATDDDVAIVTVSSAGTNLSPTASAGSDKIIKLPQTNTLLDGSGTDQDGTVTTFAWSQVSGAAATIASPTTPSTGIGGLALGDYVFRLTVTDNLGATDYNDVLVRVVSATNNLPPNVDAGPDVVIYSPQTTLTLNATASDDGTIVAMQWTKLSGPAATLSNGTTLSLGLSNLVEGAYSFQLLVTDNNGASVFDIVNVSVLPAAFQPPVVDAGPDVTITLPSNSVTLNGSASSPTGTISTTVWTQTLGPAVTLTNANTLNLTVNSMPVGTYVFKLTATDNSGSTASDNVQVIVNPVPLNQAPIVSAGTNTSIQLPTNSTPLTGTATDSDGTVASVAWTQVSGPNTATLQTPATLTAAASNLIAGTYTFKLSATDNQGAVGSSTVLILVSDVAPLPGPTVDAGQDTTLTLPDNSVSIVGIAMDPSGTIQTYEWEQVSGDQADFTVTNGNILNLTDLKLGAYTFKLTVTDDSQLSASDEVVVTVIEKSQEIPKFFSPNNDGVGEFWVFRNVESYKTCKLAVFSRSGQVVFEASPYTNSWDGTYNGKPLSDGDYYYNLKCDDGKVINGAVRIIR